MLVRAADAPAVIAHKMVEMLTETDDTSAETVDTAFQQSEKALKHFSYASGCISRNFQ